MNIIQQIERDQMDAVLAKRGVPEFQPGDTLKVMVKVIEGEGKDRTVRLQAYLDEFAFRHNRRKTKGVGRIAARVIEGLVGHKPMTMRNIIDKTTRCRWFASPQAGAAAAT